jgi:hypothetical protein
VACHFRDQSRSKYPPAKPEALCLFTAVQDIGSIESAPLLIKALGQG